MENTRSEARNKAAGPPSSIFIQIFEFVGVMVTVAAVAIAFVAMLFVVSIFTSDSNRLFLVNSFRLDYRPHSNPEPGNITSPTIGMLSQALGTSIGGLSLAWRLPVDSSGPLGTTLYETFLDIYTMEPLGAFHWGILLVAGLWILDSIGVFTLYFMNDVGTTLNATGKPRHSDLREWFARTGLFFALFALAWNFIGLIFLFVVTWRLSTTSENQQDTHKVPMTTQTLLVATAAFLASIVYFMRELKERFASSGEHAPSAPVIPVAERVVHDGVASSASRRGQSSYGAYTLIGYPIRVPQQATGELKVVSRRQYTPVLCLAWADGWALSDALILAGIVGASQNVLTHEIAAVFLSVLYASFAHTAVVRLLIDAYVNEVPNEDQAYASAYADNKFRSLRSNELKASQDLAERELFHVRVMAFLANFAVACFTTCAPYLLFTRYGPVASFAAPFITAYVAVALVVPAFLWLAGNIWLEMGWPSFLSFRTACLAEFIYGLTVRLIFVAMLVWNVMTLLTNANDDLDTYVLLWTGGGSS